MQRISLAPVLSATRSRDSCWITASPKFSRSVRRRAERSLLGLLEDLDDAPPLAGTQRPGLHEEDTVADAAGVLLVVGLELVGTPERLLVARVLDAVLDGHDDRLVHLVADDHAFNDLAEAAVLLGGNARSALSHPGVLCSRALGHAAPVLVW